ncbi:MAG TPA: hypothetical protein VGB87_14555 [Vicinamibacteria bacterium]
MACERYREALVDVATGMPAPAGLESHLTSCEACREELAVLRQALALADTELAGLLSAEPSPGLAARIRQAVAGAGPSPAWRFGWLWPATAAAATLLVALVVWPGRGPSPSPQAHGAVAPLPRESVTPGPEGSAVASVPEVVPRSAPEGPAGPTERSSPRRPRARRSEVPSEVLVPPGEGEALLRLVALVHRERLTPAGLGAAGQPSPGPSELAPLDIPPLEIVPLEPAEASGT